MVKVNKRETNSLVITQIREVADWLPIDYNFSSNALLREDLGFDSLAIVKLQMLLEESFKFHFDPVNHDLISIFNSIDNLTTFLIELNEKKL